MKRIQLFEFHDLAWFPRAWRDYLTEIMAGFEAAFHPYQPLIPKLVMAAEKLKVRTIIDLCSGAGATALSIQSYLEKMGNDSIKIILTDKYPNLGSFQRMNK